MVLDFCTLQWPDCAALLFSKYTIRTLPFEGLDSHPSGRCVVSLTPGRFKLYILSWPELVNAELDELIAEPFKSFADVEVTLFTTVRDRVRSEFIQPHLSIVPTNV